MTLKELQTETHTWIQTYGVRYFSELTNMTLLTEEVGELARLVGRQYGEQSFKVHKTESEIKQAIGDEMADILFVITCLANQMDINLTEAMKINFNKKTKRDKTRHLSNNKLKDSE